MGILYNANQTPAMNDSSVTSGNADGWVYAAALSFDPVAARPSSDQAARPGSDGRRSAPVRKASKRRAR
jgi:hypothetical protein